MISGHVFWLQMLGHILLSLSCIKYCKISALVSEDYVPYSLGCLNTIPRIIKLISDYSYVWTIWPFKANYLPISPSSLLDPPPLPPSLSPLTPPSPSPPIPLPPTPPPMMGLSNKWLFVLLNSSPFYLFTHCLIMITLKVSIIKSTLCNECYYTLDYTYLTGCTNTGECSNEKQLHACYFIIFKGGTKYPT